MLREANVKESPDQRVPRRSSWQARIEGGRAKVPARRRPQAVAPVSAEGATR